MEFTINAIGRIHTPYTDWAPHQAPIRKAEDDKFYLELLPQYAAGVAELEKFNYMILLAFLDKADREFDAMVSPPWAKGKQIGLFAGRSPNRPNPIAFTVTPIIKVEAPRIEIGPVEFFDGTPLIDIKPYIPSFDLKPDANHGWIEELPNYLHILEHLVGKKHSHDHEEHHHNHDDEGHKH